MHISGPGKFFRAFFCLAFFIPVVCSGKGLTQAYKPGKSNDDHERAAEQVHAYALHHREGAYRAEHAGGDAVHGIVYDLGRIESRLCLKRAGKKAADEEEDAERAEYFARFPAPVEGIGYCGRAVEGGGRSEKACAESPALAVRCHQT